MWNKIDKCGGCGQNGVIVNAKYYLCNDCNRFRLHGKDKGDFIKEVLEKKKKKVEEKSYKMLRTSIVKGLGNSVANNRICENERCVEVAYTKRGGKWVCRKHMWELIKKQRTIKKRRPTTQNKRESTTKNQMSDIKKMAKLSAYEQGNKCEGCCKPTTSALDYSHILSVAQRKDLELDENNKNMLCRSCHEKWESNDPQKMTSLACFYKNMTYIYKQDSKRFYSIYFKFNDAMVFDVCKKLEEIENGSK